MMRAALAIAVVLAGVSTLRADEAADADFNRAAAPLFKKYCVGCHNATDQEGELVLERHADVLAGGASGAIVVAGKADESRLIDLLTGRDEPAMPPEGNDKPSDEEIARLVAWVNAGAKPPAAGEADPTVVRVPKIRPTVDVSPAISSVAYSPDGKLLAVARYDAVDLLAIPERTLERQLGPHRGRINAVSFSKDGKRLLAAAGEPGVVGEVRLWNVADGQPAGVFEGHSDSLYAAVLSPDGKLLATSSYDQQIKLWDAANGKELRTLTGHNDAVFDLAFRPDGKILASASGDRTVKLWDVASGERLDTFGQPTKEQYCVAFSPDGNRVAAGGVDNRIRVWQISKDGKENTNPLLYARFAHEGAVVNLVYSADSKTLISAGEDRTVKVWDAEPMNERLMLEQQSDWAPALAIAPDGKTVAVGRLDGSLAIYDTATGDLVPVPPPPKPDLASLSTRGLQSGATNRIRLSGKHLAAVNAIQASHPKITSAIVGAASGTELEVDVTPAADVPRGRYELWVASPSGESRKLRVYVDELAQANETEPNDELAQANDTTLETDMWGVLAAKGDIDRFAFDAQAGQHLVFDLTGSSIGSKANFVLTLSDATGRVLADNNDFDGSSDPLLAHTIEADGRYVIEIRDLVLGGDDEFFYRLSLGELAVPTAVFPLSVPANQEAEIEVTGYNLPRGLKIKVPATANGEVTVPVDAAYRLREPLKVVVGTLPEIVEVEPNDTPEQATPLAVPGTASGRILGAAGGGSEDDYIRFQSKAGQMWIVETDAARRGAPTDTVIEVLDAAGRSIEQVLLQAVRDSTVTFRGIDSNALECRLTNWEEMQLNQLLYLNGEVVRLFRARAVPTRGSRFTGPPAASGCCTTTPAPWCTPRTNRVTSSRRTRRDRN